MRTLRCRRGQSTAEYVVIAGVVVAIVLVVSLVFRSQIARAVTTLGCAVQSAVSGQSAGGCSGGGNAAAGAGSGTGGAAPQATGPAGLVAVPAAAGTQAFADLQADLAAINQGLVDRGVYVRNFFQGDPTLVVQGLYNVAGIAWDYTAGWVTGANGQTCEGYYELTDADVRKVIEQRFPGSKVEMVTFEEKSSLQPDGVLDTLDAINTENHVLHKVTLPDGSEWAVDFHGHNSHFSSSSQPIMRPWSQAEQEWKDYIGAGEFVKG